MVICFDVEVKFFVIVSVEVWVEWWYLEFVVKGYSDMCEEVLVDVKVCDEWDMNCVEVLLKVVDDVILIDISDFLIEDVVVCVVVEIEVWLFV